MTDARDRFKGITLVAERPSYFGYLLSITVGLLFSNPDVFGHGPRVVAVNSAGKKHVVAEVKSYRVARTECRRLKTQLDELGVNRWCQLNDIPVDFCG